MFFCLRMKKAPTVAPKRQLERKRYPEAVSIKRKAPGQRRSDPGIAPYGVDARRGGGAWDRAAAPV